MRMECKHRGRPLRSEECELCGRRGQAEEVLYCDVHGSCTRRQYKVGQPEQICLICEDREPDGGDPLDQVTACITTYKRPKSLERLMKSLKHFYPNLKTIVEDTGGNLSAARNRLAKKCETPYYLMLEDDFVFTKETDLYKLLSVLESDKLLGGVGGCTAEPKIRGTAGRGGKIWWDRDFVRIRDRIYLDKPRRPWLRCEKIMYRPCDIVINFGIFRNELMKAVPWDENLPVQEHSEWYWRVFLDARWHFAYVPNVVVQHIRDRPSSEYQNKRNRDFTRYIREKLGATILKDTAPARLGAPNIVFLGVGRSNTTIFTRMLARSLHLNVGDADDKFCEERNIRFVNQRCWNSGTFDKLAAERAIRKIPQPWIIKDPRFRRNLDAWFPVFEKFKPVLFYVTKDPEVVKESHEKAGWSSVYDPADVHRCNKFFARWPWSKIKLRAEDVAAAISMFDVDRMPHV